MLGALYLHIPFCARRCIYCDFASAATEAGDPRMAAYRRALSLQLSELSDLGLLEVIETAYIGGGTPTLLGEELPKLVSGVVSLADPAELTCEANPESLSTPVARELADAGATRVSVGVQSTIAAELTALGRIHSSERALGALRDAQRAGLDVSADLMCGIPLQTRETWQESLSAVAQTGVGHVSVYPLAVEDGTPLDRMVSAGDLAVPDSNFQAECMEQAATFLELCGMHRYEVASYAKEGAECQHNKAYWTGIEYMGLGTNASSMLGSATYEVLRHAMPQLPELDENIIRIRMRVLSTTKGIVARPRLNALSFELEFLDAAQAVAEDLMLGCRMVRGAEASLLEDARMQLGAEALDVVIEDVSSRGLAQLTGDGRLVPTHDGWLLGNELYGALWDLAPGKVVTLTV